MARIFARLTCTALAVAGAVLPVTPAAAQESRPTVAVMTFNSDVAPQQLRDYEGLNKAIAAFVAGTLSANPGLRVVERDVVQRAIEGQHLAAGRVTRESAVAAAKALGAQKAVMGRFVPDQQGNLRVDARVLDVASGAVEFTDRVQDRSDNLGALVGRLGAHLTTALGVSAGPAAAAGETQLPLRYAIMYGQALDLSDRGERARAAELYSAVLKDYPAYEPARRGLTRLKPQS